MSIQKKEIILGIIASFLLAILIFLSQIKKPLKEEEIISPSSFKEETTEELLRRLTPTSVSPKTEEEIKETEELLEKLTPQKSFSQEEEEKKVTQELLKELTPQ